MQYLVEKTDQLEKEIEGCLNNGLFIAALTLTLTIPDIYEKLENKLQGTNKDRYTSWMREYLIPQSPRYETNDASFLDDIYALRCVVLHDGQNSIEFQRARKQVHRFSLMTTWEDRRTHLWGINGLEQVEDHKMDNYSEEDLNFYELTNTLDEDDIRTFAFHYKNITTFNVFQFYIDIKKAMEYFVEVHKDSDKINLMAKDIFPLNQKNPWDKLK